MSRAEESCFRVPVRQPVTQVETSGSLKRTKRAAKRTKLGVGMWEPIISALDAEAATVKASEMFPEAIVGEPVFRHGPGNHRSEAMNLQLSRLARAGFA